MPITLIMIVSVVGADPYLLGSHSGHSVTSPPGATDRPLTGAASGRGAGRASVCGGAPGEENTD